MVDGSIHIRLLTAEDIPPAQRLRELAGWNQTDADWSNLVSFEPQGCFVAELDGKLVGTATTTTYRGAEPEIVRLGWVGMVLVDPAQRRRGIGSALLTHCIDYLRQRGTLTIKLDATPAGHTVYEKMGFVDEYPLNRWEGCAHASKTDSAIRIELLNSCDIGVLAEYDSNLYGADRSQVLAAWHKAWPECAIAAYANSGAFAGYALARRGVNYHQVGPLAADSPEVGARLFDELLNRLAGTNVIVDIPSMNLHAVDMARRRGLTIQRPLLRMFLGPNEFPGQPDKIVAIAGPEVG